MAFSTRALIQNEIAKAVEDFYWSSCLDRASKQIDFDNVFDKPVCRKFEVVTLSLHEYELAGLVQGLEPDPVLRVDRGLPQGQDVLGPETFVK